MIAINHAQSWVYLSRPGELMVAVCHNSVKIGLDETSTVSSVGPRGGRSQRTANSVFLTNGVLGSKNHRRVGGSVMMDLLTIMVRWIVGLLRGGDAVAPQEFLLVPVAADFGRRDGGQRTNSPGVGWKTMRLDPVLPAHVLSQSALCAVLWQPVHGLCPTTGRKLFFWLFCRLRIRFHRIARGLLPCMRQSLSV